MMTDLMAFYILVLVAITAFVILSKLPSILKTALLSVATLIHSIVLIGAMIVMGQAHTTIEIIIGFIAVLLASANAVGGFALTNKVCKAISKSYQKSHAGDE